MKKRVILLAVLLLVTMIPMTFTGTANATGYTLYPSFPISSMPTVPQYPVVYPQPSVPVAYTPSLPKPSAPSAYYYGSLGSRTLKRTYPCMSGADVRTLQTMLNALGYSCGRVDGKFGDRTKAAVIAFQRRNGLKVDGIVGRATKTRLLSRYRNRR